MAFLDNSGDIILDAVLTDTGRMRLAKGDGRFRIAKFALGDDEIDYGLYNKNHPSGSAYYGEAIEDLPQMEIHIGPLTVPPVRDRAIMEYTYVFIQLFLNILWI